MTVLGGEADASRVVDVRDFSDTTLRNIAAHVQVSREFSHFVYREAELDTVLGLVTTALRRAEAGNQAGEVGRLQRLLQWASEAHNFIGERNPAAASRSLQEALQAGPWGTDS